MVTHRVQPPEWIDSAPILNEQSADIDAPRADVWRHIADHSAWPEWFTDLNCVEELGSPTGVGGGRRVFVGRDKIDEEFTAWDIGDHFAFSIIGSPSPVLDSMAESVPLVETETSARVRCDPASARSVV